MTEPTTQQVTMTSPAASALYQLLPAIHRLRDAGQGMPLAALLNVIGEQLDVIEDDLSRLYANWFIETCEDWVVPYIGDLVGYRLPSTLVLPEEPASQEAQRLLRFLFPRRAVANLVRDRRRKGTLALLEELAEDLAGWPARAVELRSLLGVSQPVRLLGTTDAAPRLWGRRGRTADLRDGEALDLVGGPFERLARTIDVRRPGSSRTPGRHGVTGVGLFVWPLQPYTVTKTPALCLEEEDPHRYTFSVLGNDTPLFTRAGRREQPSHIAGPLDVPTPVRRRAFERHQDDYYGQDRSIEIYLGAGQDPVLPGHVVAADLAGWHYRPLPGKVLVDPERGRMLFAHDLLEETRAGVAVSYVYGFSMDIGGGEYDRPLSARQSARILRVQTERELRDALRPWLDPARIDAQPPHAVVEITASGVYDVPLELHLGAAHSLQIRAANRCRPVIRLPDRSTGPDALRVIGQEGSTVAFDGLLVTGNAVQVEGGLAEVAVRHCTLVPGWGLGPGCEPHRPARPSLEVIDTGAQVCVEHSVVGSIQVTHNEVRREPVRICVSDTILDATSHERAALSALGGDRAHATVTFARATVIGTVLTHAIALAENSIFAGEIHVARRQIGCMRFCSSVPGSRTPRRFHCQPDLVDSAVEATHPDGPRRDAAREQERLRVLPRFDSTRYGTPDYGRLASTCAEEISEGATDGSEMGAFHDLYEPQRAASLRAGLSEYTPADVETGIIEAG